MFRCNYCGSHFVEPDIKRCRPYRIYQGGLPLCECDTKEVCPDCEYDDIEEVEDYDNL